MAHLFEKFTRCAKVCGLDCGFWVLIGWADNCGHIMVCELMNETIRLAENQSRSQSLLTSYGACSTKMKALERTNS